MEKLQNFAGAATLDELSTTAEEGVTEESASDEPGLTTAEEPAPSTAAEDTGVEPCGGATDEDSSSQPITKAQPITEKTHAKFLTHLFIRVSFFSIK
jgi:hypothetical protein